MRAGLVFTLACAALAACGGEESRPPAQLVGAIVEVQSDEGSVVSFTLEAGGDTHTIYIATEIDYGFDLRHLHEHRTTGEPVRCTLEERGERLYALEIADA